MNNVFMLEVLNLRIDDELRLSLLQSINIDIEFIIDIDNKCREQNKFFSNIPTEELELNVNYVDKMIDSLPDDTTVLDLSGGEFTRDLMRFTNLKVLIACSCGLTDFSKIPPSVEVLCVSGNNITKLENVPPLTKHLNISGNLITKIENIKDTQIKNLVCSSNFERIENLPNTLNYFKMNDEMHCDVNEDVFVSHLDKLPDTIKSFDCNFFVEDLTIRDQLSSCDLVHLCTNVF